MHTEYKARHGALKKELNLYQDENQSLHCQVVQLEEYEEQVEELTEQNTLLEDKVRKLCELTVPKEERYKREREMMAQEVQEKDRASELLEKEAQSLREQNKRLTSQLRSVESCISRKTHGEGLSPKTSSHHLGDVWQQLDHAQQQHQILQTQIDLSEAFQKKQNHQEHEPKPFTNKVSSQVNVVS